MYLYFKWCAVLVIILLILLYLYLTSNFNYWKNKNCLFVKPIPIFGNIYNIFIMKISIGEFLQQLYNQTQNQIYGFFVFNQPYLLVRDPEIIKRILIKDFDSFYDRSMADNERDDFIGSQLLLLLKNPSWKSLRDKSTAAFTTSKMKKMFPFMLDGAKELSDYLRNVAVKEPSTDVGDVALKFATDVLTSCTFGINANSFRYDEAEFYVTSKRMIDGIDISRKIQMASYYFAPSLVKLFRMKFVDPIAASFLEDIFTASIAERYKTGAFRGDFIDIIIELREKGELVDMKLASVLATTYFLAGFENSRSILEFALYELCLHPEVQQRAREEIQTVIKGHVDVCYNTTQQLIYLDMVIKETLRKYPLLPFLDRRCNKPYKIPELDFTIDAGTPVYMSLLGLHFDPEYFPNPDQFDPDRFSRENITKIPNKCYLPFGSGPRICIGSRLGVLIIKIGLISILNEFEVIPASNTAIPVVFDPKGFLLAPKNGIHLKFKHIS